MAKAEPAQTQTVEQILASIRNAISDDEARRGFQRSSGQPRQPMQAAGEADQTDEPEAEDAETQGVINLAIEKAIDGVRAELGGEKPGPAADAGDRRPLSHAAARAQSRPHSMPPPRGEARSLLSARSGAAVSASFDTLARSVAPGNGRKLEELVEGLLRPMLRTWLDDNLPLLVERLVREEIERVSRGGR